METAENNNIDRDDPKPAMQSKAQTPAQLNHRQEAILQGLAKQPIPTELLSLETEQLSFEKKAEHVIMQRPKKIRKHTEPPKPGYDFDKFFDLLKKNAMTTVLITVMSIIMLAGLVYSRTRTIPDTTPPTATAINKTIQIGTEITPEEFLINIYDESPIESITFESEPDIFSRRVQTVRIIIEDIHGNRAVFSSTLTVQLNDSPPVIIGADTIETTIGNPIMYRQGVTAFDDFGRELEFQVDSSDVDQHTAGTYYVTYWVEDFTGHRTEHEVAIHVISIDPEEVLQQVDTILGGIVTSGMSQLETVRAIHEWITANMSYSAVRSGLESVYEGAHVALRDRRGNCFIFYSISEVLLTRAGIENMRIERIPGTPTRHSWNLINPDDLGWHHFDATPSHLPERHRLAFFTASEARDFTRQLQNILEVRDFYTYNPELYPTIVE